MFCAINARKLVKRLLPFILVFAAIAALFIFVRFAYPVRYLPLINELSERHNLEPALVLAVINAESRFRPNAASPAGAKGLMQIMDATARWIEEQAGLSGYADRVYEPEANIAMGCWYMERLLRQFDNRQTALAAYNAGSGNVGRWLDNPDYSPDGVNLAYIPFPETRQYVKRVETNRRVYSILLRFTR